DIPTVILIFKKNRTNKDILFIDASKEFQKGKNHNAFLESHINKILSAYKKRGEIDKFSHVVNLDEIKENDFNLNIPRYVDTFEEEQTIPLSQIQRELAEIDREIDKSEKELARMMNELVGN